MKKPNVLASILICGLAICVIIFTKAIYVDDDSFFEVLGNSANFFAYDELFENILSTAKTFYVHFTQAISSKSIIAYLERQEKSPPLFV